MPEQRKLQTPTEILMEVMEDFGDAEGRSIVVIYTNDQGDLKVNSNAGLVQSRGMLECALDMAKMQWRKG